MRKITTFLLGALAVCLAGPAITLVPLFLLVCASIVIKILLFICAEALA